MIIVLKIFYVLAAIFALLMGLVSLLVCVGCVSQRCYKYVLLWGIYTLTFFMSFLSFILH